MKRFGIIVLLLVLTAGLGFAQISIEANLGANFLVSEVEDYGGTVNKFALPAMLGAGYRLPFDVEFGSLGKSVFTVGGKAGFINNIVSVEYSLLGNEIKSAYYTIPAFAFGRAEVGFLFFEFGLGVHAWFMDTYMNGEKMDMGSDNGIDFAAYLFPGLKLSLMEKMSLFVGPSLMSMGIDPSAEGAADMAALTLGAMVGIAYTL